MMLRAGPAPALVRAAAAPRGYALIKTTVCTSGPGPNADSPYFIPLPGPVSPAPRPLAPMIAAPSPDATEPFPGPFLPLPPGPDDGPYIIPFAPPAPPPGGPTVVSPPPPTTAVPEPHTWLLLILGFAALGARLRQDGARRKSPGGLELR